MSHSVLVVSMSCKYTDLSLCNISMRMKQNSLLKFKYNQEQNNEFLSELPDMWDLLFQNWSQTKYICILARKKKKKKTLEMKVDF